MKKKRILAVLLSSAIAFSGMPGNVFAAEEIVQEDGFSDEVVSNEDGFISDIIMEENDTAENITSETDNSITSGSCGDHVAWNLSGTVLTITGSGKMDDYLYDSVKPWSEATEVIIEEGVTSIGNYAFRNCNNIESIKIPASVSLIGSMRPTEYYQGYQGCVDAFDYEGGNLVNIEVNENNALFASYNGVLYSKDKTKLLYCPRQIKNLEIPKETKHIFVSAMACCENLESVILPEGLESIGICAFEHCNNLSEIVIPESVTSIGTRAFYKTNPTFKVYKNSYGERYVEGSDKIEIIGEHIHVWDDGEVKSEGDCTTEGSIVYKCTTCGLTREEKTPKKGHSYVLCNECEATCMTEGYTGDWICSLCGDILEEGKVIPQKEHNWDAGIITKTPTCENTGVKTYTCSVSGETKTEEIPATGHSWSDWKIVREATVTSEGEKQRTCTKCGKVEKLSIEKVIPKATPIPTNTPEPSATPQPTVVPQPTNTPIPTAAPTNPSILTVTKGKTTSVKPDSSWKNVKYSTSNKKVATVDKKGKVKAVAAGTAKITVKSGSKKAIYTIIVPGTTAIKGIKSSVSVKKGKTYTLKPKLSYTESPDKVTYKSSNKKIATVSKSGVIKGKKKGTVTITIKSGKVIKKCKVKVK